MGLGKLKWWPISLLMDRIMKTAQCNCGSSSSSSSTPKLSSLTEMLEQQEPQAQSMPQLGSMESSIDNSSKGIQRPKLVVLADLNVDPPESDGNDSVQLPASDFTRFFFFPALFPDFSS